MLEKEKNTQGIDGNNNLQVQNSKIDVVNLYSKVADEKIIELTIIGELFEFIKQSSSSRRIEGFMSNNDKFLKVDKKIQLNFQDEEERTAVKDLFLLAYSKIATIEERFSNADSDYQLEFHSHLLGLYLENKINGMSPIQNLFDLFKQITPPDKLTDPKFTSCAKAVVLFFFDDCTIFEKTKEEKSSQMNLFQC